MTTEEEFLTERSYQKQAEFLIELGSVCLHGPLPEATQKRVMDCAFSMHARCAKVSHEVEMHIDALQKERKAMIEAGVGEGDMPERIEWLGKLLEILD